MSKNLSDIFPPTEIGGGGGGGIEEAPRDGRMYARQEQQNTGMGWTAFDPGNLDPGTEDDQVLLWHTADDKWSASNTVPAVQSGPTPPFNPVEGTLWMEVPNQGDATMWVYTKDSGGNGRWLQHPGGKDGAPGADGNIADATEQGVIATWDNTTGQWTPEGAVVVSGSNVGIGTSNPTRALSIEGEGAGCRVEVKNKSNAARISLMSPDTGTPQISFDNGLLLTQYGQDRLTIDATGSATFSGKVYSDGGRFGRTGQGGIALSTDVMYPTGPDLEPNDATMSLGTTGAGTHRFKDAYFSGTVDAAGFTVNGSPIGGGGGLPDGGYTYGWNITAADFIATSDERLKDNITTAPVGLIDSLKGREWDWSESGEKGSGVVAQELEQVLPHLVHEDDNGVKSVSYMGLLGYLIEEVKALKAEVEALKS